MAERPLLVSGPLIGPILRGEKTVTRRLLPAVFNSPPGLIAQWHPPGTWSRMHPAGAPDYAWGAGWRGTYPSIVRCPFGAVGDVLWVRETWAHTTLLGNPITVYSAEDNRTDYGGPWKPSIHMKRADARIFLRVESVTVERVQEITEEDAAAEGVVTWPYFLTAREAFEHLWDSLAPVGSKWPDNPWVWVVKFKRVTP